MANPVFPVLTNGFSNALTFQHRIRIHRRATRVGTLEVFEAAHVALRTLLAFSQPVNCIFWPIGMLNWLVAASKLHKHRETCCTAEWPFYKFYSFLILCFPTFAPSCCKFTTGCHALHCFHVRKAVATNLVSIVQNCSVHVCCTTLHTKSFNRCKMVDNFIFILSIPSRRQYLLRKYSQFYTRLSEGTRARENIPHLHRIS